MEPPQNAQTQFSQVTADTATHQSTMMKALDDWLLSETLKAS